MSCANLNKSSQVIALVDCNNFYASCERVFNPAWQHLPIAVLSNNDGCIIARSNEVKEAGIPMGAPYFQWKQQLRQIHAMVVSSNYTLYGDMSARVMDTLARFTPDMEIYSIDEAWLNLDHIPPLDIDNYSKYVVAHTKQSTGIPVSMGISCTKTLAKIANRLCKKLKCKEGVYHLDPNQSDFNAILRTVQVEDIWGIGRRLAVSLTKRGIVTAYDLMQCEPDTMRQSYNVVMQRIVIELRGVACITTENLEAKKQIISSRSFGQKVTDIESLREAVAMHATRGAEKLRSQRSVCSVLQVAIRTAVHIPNEKYYARSATIHFDVATADSRKLIHAATRAITHIYRSNVRYAKAGIVLMGISPANTVQDGLFQRADSEASQRLMQAIDGINAKYGRKKVYFAAEGKQNAWKMKSDLMTPAYTTNWCDIPLAR